MTPRRVPILAPVLALALLAAGPAAAAEDAVAQARAAAAALQASIAAMQKAEGATDRVKALTTTIVAYESGLSALRAGLRRVTFREDALRAEFASKRQRISQLLGVLSAIGRSPGPISLLNPDGPLGTVRAGMLVSDVTPGLQAEAEGLRKQLAEVAALRASQEAAAQALKAGLKAVEAARVDLSQAVSDRKNLPKNFTESPSDLAMLASGVKTLGDFADALSDRRMAQANPTRTFSSAKGTLPWPVQGTILRHAGQADAAGIVRPGVVIATRPRALVTAPWDATIRYRGPLLDYGNVMILEPGGGYLIILAGLDQVYGNVGDIITAGTPVGLMGGKDADPKEFMASTKDGGGAGATETLYMELRQGATPVNPEDWFAKAKE
ncbi:murein hydrolase activator EnvC family protein [Solirhodobacter olei]|uniref:murein hydrolase activator EnvC family protein n=1 Tax=Solirhodobacter olei TaxID=2493082 RepID=UPI000FD77B99|nr:peptidoglycan DD-metalloendopeptidase family protein [Solirhodobacter olei]